MATLLKVLNNLADIKSAGVLHFALELRRPGFFSPVAARSGNLAPAQAKTATAFRLPRRRIGRTRELGCDAYYLSIDVAIDAALPAI